jgi:hypothetical protein
MTEEIWKDIPGYENIYQVSSLGNVKSLSRKILNQGLNEFYSKEKILKKHVSTNGKYIVVLRKNNLPKTIQVHQLVAIAFLNHVPNGHKIVVDHIDNNPLNNKLSNLQIITQRENASKDRKNKSSKYTGVSWVNSHNKWYAGIQIKGKSKSLGFYENEIDAHNAYQNKLKELTC